MSWYISLCYYNCTFFYSIDGCKDNDNELVENQTYGTSVPTTYYNVSEEPQMAMVDDSTSMRRNICYASSQHVEISSDENYNNMREEQSIDNMNYNTM